MYLAELRAKIIAPLVSDKYRSWQAQSSPSKPELDNVGRREVKIMLSVQPDMGKMSVGSASLPGFPFSTGRGAGAAIAKSPGCVIRSSDLTPDGYRRKGLSCIYRPGCLLPLSGHVQAR